MGPSAEGRSSRGVAHDATFGGDLPAMLREAFLSADYTADGVLAALGEPASAALGRGQRVPARRATSGGSPLETLIRLFLLQDAVPAASLPAGLPVERLLYAGIVHGGPDAVRAAIDIRPYDADDAGTPWWVASDLGRDFGRTAPLRRDHVLGVGGASMTLAQLVVREPVGRALDLGTGCGVQALHLSRHSTTVVATDVLPRALAFARLTARLSGVPDDQLDLREGSLYDPVAGERFDLVVANPPFVVHPDGGSSEYAYRDSGLPGDEVCARLVSQVTAHLNDGGRAQLLGNWVHGKDGNWQDRVASWLPSGVDAWVVQRDVQDIADYVALWLGDSGEAEAGDYEQRYDDWMAAFERSGIDAVGFGWICLRASGSAKPVVRVEEWPHAIAQPLGSEVEAWGQRQDWLRHRDDESLLAGILVVDPRVRQEQFGVPGAEDPEAVVLRQQHDMCRAEQVGTELAALIGACDGSLPLGVLVDAVAAVCGREPAGLRAELLPTVRRMVEQGYLLPSGFDQAADRPRTC